MAPSAERALARLPEKVATAIVEFLVGPLLDEPQKIGRPLRGELDGLWVARRGAYRIVFELDDPKRTVQVLRIDHRADVYR